MKKDRIEYREYPDGCTEWKYLYTYGKTIAFNIDFPTAQKEIKEQGFKQQKPGAWQGDVFVVEYVQEKQEVRQNSEQGKLL